jgi:hypothetical protein
VRLLSYQATFVTRQGVSLGTYTYVHVRAFQPPMKNKEQAKYNIFKMQGAFTSLSLAGLELYRMTLGFIRSLTYLRMRFLQPPFLKDKLVNSPRTLIDLVVIGNKEINVNAC